jgi:hypothetical protein
VLRLVWGLVQVREVRAVMCCFMATDAREACLQQLRYADDWSPVDPDTDRRVCRTALVSRSTYPTIHTTNATALLELSQLKRRRLDRSPRSS